MHLYTCESLLNTLGSALEQLAVFPAKQRSRGQSTTVSQPARSVKMPYEYLMR